MTESTLALAFYASLAIGVPLGVALMVLWARRVFKRIVRTAESTSTLTGVSMATVFWMTPGLLAFLACSLPCLYLGHQRTQLDYCVEVIRVNGLARAESTLNERCAFFSREELVQRAATPR